MAGKAWNSTLRPGGPLKRSTPLNRVNRDRKARRKEKDEVYGSYHWKIESLFCILSFDTRHECRSFPGRKPIEGHHVKSVGSGGKDRGNEVPLCPLAHDEVEQIGRKTFEAKWGVNLKQEAKAAERRIDD